MSKPRKTRSGLNGQAVKDLKHKISVLKRKGLVSAKVDARKDPSRYMARKVKNLEGIFEGTKAGVKVAPKMARQYREAGFEVIRNRVIVPKEKEEIASIKKGLPLIRKVGGSGERLYKIERVILPFKPSNIDEFIREVERDPDAYEELKRPQDVWAFKLFGHNSLATFEDLRLLLEYLRHYMVFDTQDADDAWDSFILYAVFPPGSWRTGYVRRKKERNIGDRREVTRQRHTKAMGSKIYLEREAQRKREYRARAGEKYREGERLRKAAQRQDPIWKAVDNLKRRMAYVPKKGRRYRGTEDGT